MKLVIPREEPSVAFEELYIRHGLIFDVAGCETRLNWSSSLAQGFINWTQVKAGLQIQFNSFRPRTNLAITASTFASDPIQFNFYLSGNSRGIFQDGAHSCEFNLNPGHSLILFGGEEIVSIWECLAQNNIQAIEILVEPWLLSSLFAHNSPLLPQPLEQIIAGDYLQPYYQIEIITPAMQMALHQLLNCAYQGSLKQVYMESKALELITLKLAQIQELTTLNTQLKILKSADIERIHHAKEILLEEMENPPSLLALARRVGLNDYKLKQGFRQVFGTTVFGYLRSQRMEKARQLLTESDIKVSQVALLVGYASLSRFSAAFKQQFGINPSACRR